MSQINIVKDIIPLAEFKSKLSGWIKKLKTDGRPLVITQNGKPAAAVIKPVDFNKYLYRKSFIEDLELGLDDHINNRLLTDDEVHALIEKITGKN